MKDSKAMSGFGTNLDLFLKLKTSGDLKNYEYLSETIVSIVGDMSDGDRTKICEFCRVFTSNLAKKWADANRIQKTFFHRNQNWLESNINWPKCDSVNLYAIMGSTQEIPVPEEVPAAAEIYQPEPSASTSDASTSTTSQTRKPFEDLSNKQKRRRTNSMVEDYSEDELLYFYVSKLKKGGKLELAKIVEHLGKNFQAVEDVTKLLFRKEKQATISEDKTLAMHIALDLSKWKYLSLRSFLREEICSEIPSYQKLLKARKRCYPTTMEFTEQGASIK